MTIVTGLLWIGIIMVMTCGFAVVVLLATPWIARLYDKYLFWVAECLRK